MQLKYLTANDRPQQRPIIGGEVLELHWNSLIQILARARVLRQPGKPLGWGSPVVMAKTQARAAVLHACTKPRPPVPSDKSVPAAALGAGSRERGTSVATCWSH